MLDRVRAWPSSLRRLGLTAGFAIAGLGLAGCAAPIIGSITLGQFMTALSLTTTVVAGRGTADIALGLILGKDCRLLEGALRQDRDFCEEPGSPATRHDFRGLAGLAEDAGPPSATALAAMRLREDYDWTTVPLLVAAIEVPAEPAEPPAVVAAVALPVAGPTRGAAAGLSVPPSHLARLPDAPHRTLDDPFADQAPPEVKGALVQARPATVRHLAMAERELAAEFAPGPPTRRATAPARRRAPRPFAERQPDAPLPWSPAAPVRGTG